MTTELPQIQNFNGDNFHLWKFQMEIILEAKDLLSITDDSEVKPEIEDIAKFSEWKKKDAKSKMLITTALEFKYLQQIVNCQTSAEMWKKLSTIYELKSETNKYLLQQRFFEYKMNPNDNIASHISKVETQAQQMKDLGNFKPNNALMTFSKFNRNSTASNKQQQHQQSIKDKKKNTHCGYCKKKGHWWKECYKRKEEQKGQQPSSSARDDSCAFSAETSAFLAGTKDSLIADSGATDHMTFRREWFSTFEEIPEGVHPVCLGDGKKIYAKGPKLQQDIFNILIRFRKRQIAYSGDIEKMYRQVRIDSRDCDFQRILWRKNPSEPLLDYRLLTVTYGLSCAPYLAMRTLHQLARDKVSTLPVASKIVQTDFYVDDLLSGADTIEEATCHIREVNNLLSSAGFSLRKWRSNVPEVLSGLSEQVEDRHNLWDFESDSCVKILGICWNPSLDIFQILVNDIPEQTNSKRHLLSHISRIFDPIGWLSPVIIRLKILLQSLWKQKLNWDDPLPDTLCSQWKKIEKELSVLNKIQIPRYFSCRGALLSVELHGFCDSSEVAYAAVFYVRSHFKSGKVKVSLIASKTRVAPLKMISIPRLELCAALLLATLYDTIRNSLCLQIDRVFLWTDSKIVLSWIKSESRHWKPFVGNRIAEIQRLTLHSSWHYVISKNNPADCASRGITPSELVDHSLWWRGPTWLSDVNFEDPIQTQYDFPKEISGERRKTFSVFHSTNLLFLDFIFKYSNINELVRITAWIYRFVFNAQCSYNERKKGHLSSSELTSSIHNIIRFIPSSEFHSEITCCKQKKSLPTNSRLLSLNPFTNESGLLRVGGRLRHSNLQFDEKHPIILPRDHFITELIVRQCHLDHLHSGLQLTMSALGLRYWIPAGRSLVKKLFHQCRVCFRVKRQVTKQIMGDLPMHRIVKSNPFTKTGIDFAGPFLMKPSIKRSKVKLKSYVALFVCFCTKAIHIEIVSDLSSVAFLTALKRFISRRGKPSDIFSDNGTNFRGANNVLREQFDILKASTIKKFISNERINWHFIPPSAPNFGGIWEAGIKSFKFHLLRCLKSQILTFEELSTLTTQIEACLNSRPICPLSSDSDDFNPLTPGHFLIGRPLTALPESYDDDVPINYLDRWSLNKKLKDVFWKRWNREYLNNLQQRLK
ncbi:hypothetical protein LAZ67_2002452 [Cordylochernes scorpioides]|uniref:Integrase catalytic domain-containing protein n=1 Tax=Cordylochernes scorpioides TaxID=51811 RepID=A0ABY6K2Y8_9ARAC|nr:hypothetical protein LAZ67_2002452 [Cordylochernes scorpioides]